MTRVTFPPRGVLNSGEKDVRSPRRNFSKISKFQQKGCNKRQSPRRKIEVEIQQKGRTLPEEKTRNSQLARRPSELHQAPPDRRYTHRGFVSLIRAKRATAAKRTRSAAVKQTPHRVKILTGKKLSKASKKAALAGIRKRKNFANPLKENFESRREHAPRRTAPTERAQLPDKRVRGSGNGRKTETKSDTKCKTESYVCVCIKK